MGYQLSPPSELRSICQPVAIVEPATVQASWMFAPTRVGVRLDAPRGVVAIGAVHSDRDTPAALCASTA